MKRTFTGYFFLFHCGFRILPRRETRTNRQFVIDFFFLPTGLASVSIARRRRSPKRCKHGGSRFPRNLPQFRRALFINTGWYRCGTTRFAVVATIRPEKLSWQLTTTKFSFHRIFQEDYSNISILSPKLKFNIRQIRSRLQAETEKKIDPVQQFVGWIMNFVGRAKWLAFRGTPLLPTISIVEGRGRSSAEHPLLAMARWVDASPHRIHGSLTAANNGPPIVIMPRVIIRRFMAVSGDTCPRGWHHPRG